MLFAGGKREVILSVLLLVPGASEIRLGFGESRL